MSEGLDRKLVKLLEDECSLHSGRFFEAGYCMAFAQVLGSDIPYIKDYGAPLWDKEEWLLDTLAMRKEKLKKEHARLEEETTDFGGDSAQGLALSC